MQAYATDNRQKMLAEMGGNPLGRVEVTPTPGAAWPFRVELFRAGGGWLVCGATAAEVAELHAKRAEHG